MYRRPAPIRRRWPRSVLKLNPWLGGLLGSAVAASVGVAIGLACFRLKGHYFVIATLVLAESVSLLFAEFRKWSAPRWVQPYPN